MNSENTIEERLKLVIEEKFGLGVELKPSTRFVEDLHFDSQDTLDLSMAVEEEFGFHTIRDLRDEACQLQRHALARSKNGDSVHIEYV